MHMAALLAEVGSWYDTVLVDTPPLLPVTDAAAISPAADRVLLVTRFRKTTREQGAAAVAAISAGAVLLLPRLRQTAREQVAAAVAAISAVWVPLLGTVLTMVPRRGPRAYARYHTYYASPPSPEHPPSPTAPRVTPRQDVRPHTNG